MIRIIDRLFTRQRERPSFSRLPPLVRHRLTLACKELSEAEQEIAERLELPQAPRLLMVDEEEAVILTPADRAEIG